MYFFFTLSSFQYFFLLLCRCFSNDWTGKCVIIVFKKKTPHIIWNSEWLAWVEKKNRRIKRCISTFAIELLVFSSKLSTKAKKSRGKMVQQVNERSLFRRVKNVFFTFFSIVSGVDWFFFLLVPLSIRHEHTHQLICVSTVVYENNHWKR